MIFFACFYFAGITRIICLRSDFVFWKKNVRLACGGADAEIADGKVDKEFDMPSLKKKFSWKWLYRKIVLQEGSPESVARGAAIGLFTGFVIPIGFQTFVVFPLAFLFRANKILSFVFTMVTNPYTVFFIYPLQCYIGSLILMRPMSMGDIEIRLRCILREQTFQSLMNLGGDVAGPFLAGGALLGIVSAPIGYFASYGMIQRYRQRKEARLRKRLAAAASRCFGPDPDDVSRKRLQEHDGNGV